MQSSHGLFRLPIPLIMAPVLPFPLEYRGAQGKALDPDTAGQLVGVQ